MKGRKMDIELLRLKRRELQVLEEQYEKQRRDRERGWKHETVRQKGPFEIE